MFQYWFLKYILSQLLRWRLANGKKNQLKWHKAKQTWEGSDHPWLNNVLGDLTITGNI